MKQLPDMLPDIYFRLRNILQLRFTELFSSLPSQTLDKISPSNPFKRFLRVIGYSIIRLIGNIFKPIHQKEILQNKIWLYVVSQNNYESLSFIRSSLNDSVFVAGQSKQIGRYNSVVNRLSLKSKILYYWQWPFALYYFLKNEGNRGWRYYDLIFIAIGYYEVYYITLLKYKPRVVIFANDHNDDSRAMLLACKKAGIPTAYIQHASVSTNFPPLEFDLNLLEGQDALDKYSLCGNISGIVSLIGMPKADSYIANRNINKSIKNIGIASNLLDDLNSILALIKHLTSVFPDLKFTLRPHPGDKRNFGFIFNEFPMLLSSSANKESVFEFLQQQDCLIAADTSTHLEATLLNLASIYYRFDSPSDFDDYYGFVAHGLVDRANSLDELDLLLARYRQDKPLDLYQRARYYSATLGTPWEGKSKEVALRELSIWFEKNK